MKKKTKRTVSTGIEDLATHLYFHLLFLVRGLRYSTDSRLTKLTRKRRQC